MNLHIVAVLACMALFREATCLQCYVCSTTPGRVDTPGCTPGLPMDDQFLKTCEPTQLYCVTAEVKAFLTSGDSVTNINLSCESSSPVSTCVNDTGTDPIEYSTSCFNSCTTDGCNAHLVVATTTPEVTTTPELMTNPKVVTMPKNNQTSASPPTSTDPSKSVPKTAKPIKITTAPMTTTTTSAAQAMRLNMHTFCSLFVSVMCALLLSGLNRND